MIHYFTGQTEEFPQASGSFTRLPEDNSQLALSPADWGKEGGTYKVGKWSHQGKKALWDHVVLIQNEAHWLLESSRWECDDYNPPTPPVGSFWRIYVRWVFAYTIVSVWDILKELTWTRNDCTFSMCVKTTMCVNCSTVWSNTSKTNVKMLQVVQNFAGRIVLGLRKHDHIYESLKSLKWLSVSDKLFLCDSIMVHKCPWLPYEQIYS